MSYIQPLSRYDQERLFLAQQNLLQQRKNNTTTSNPAFDYSEVIKQRKTKRQSELTKKNNLEIDKILAEAKEKMCSTLGKTTRHGTLRKDRIKRNLTIYSAFLEAANHYLKQNTECDPKHFSSVCFFTVLDIISTITGYACSTCELAFKDLRDTNLIATRREYQKTTFKGTSQNACIGVWLSINLRPNGQYRPMILNSERPNDPPRNLQLDRKNKFTAWEIKKKLKHKIGESLKSEKEIDTYKYLLLWALPKLDLDPCVKKDSPILYQSPLDAVQDAIDNIYQTHPKKRPETIEQAARSIGRLLNDHNRISIMNYCKILWNGLRDQTLGSLLQAIRRTYIYKTESHKSKYPLQKPGAYLQSLL